MLNSLCCRPFTTWPLESVTTTSNATTWVPVRKVNAGGSDLAPPSVRGTPLAAAAEGEGVPADPGDAAAFARLVAAGGVDAGGGGSGAPELSAAEISIVSGAESPLARGGGTYNPGVSSLIARYFVRSSADISRRE